MTDANAYNRVVPITLVLLLAVVCAAEYDLYCMGSSYTIDHLYIKSMADFAGIPLKAGRSEVYGNMNDILQRATGRPLDRDNPLHELATGTIDVLAMTATRP